MRIFIKALNYNIQTDRQVEERDTDIELVQLTHIS